MPQSTHTADEYDFVSHDETALSPEVVAKIREWLQPTDYLAESGEFRRHLASQAPGTGLWICKTEEYRKWHKSPDHGSLWIKGVPGAGKSVTAASIIQHLRTTEDCPVLFFFFRNIVAANFSPRALIQDWLAQLLPHSPKLQFALKPLLESKLAEASDNDLIQLFLDGVTSVSKVYCVGDALDEMDADSRPFLDKLNSLATFRPRSLKLLITSRPKQYLQSALRDSSIVHISLQQQLVDADIVSYLHHRFGTAPKHETQQQMKQKVVDMVARRSEGLFLYAKLTMDQVEESLRAQHLVDIVALEESLPLGLEQTYTSVLAKQRQEESVTLDLQVLVLEAVTHASRPLRLYELASMVKCTCPDAAGPQAFKSLIARSCGPLVEILEDETLQVIHHSFTEFLRGENRSLAKEEDYGMPSTFPVIDSSKAHRRMAINCLGYLKSGALLLGTEKDHDIPQYRGKSHSLSTDESDPFDYREARLNHPFLRYAVENWAYHARHYDVEDTEFFDAITEFARPESLTFRRWLRLQVCLPVADREGVVIIPTTLHIASFCGMSELASKLIREGADISAVDGQKLTPLHWAAMTGHAKVVAILLANGCEPDAPNEYQTNPFILAVRGNHTEAMTLLLKAGVKLDISKAMEGRGKRMPHLERTAPALHYISTHDRQEAALAVIPFCTSELLEHFLRQCCSCGSTNSALVILKHSDVSVNTMHRGWSALHFACTQCDVECVEALLAHAADPNQPSMEIPLPRKRSVFRDRFNFDPPIHCLVSKWEDKNDAACQAILRMLIRAGADINQPNNRHFTALFYAVGVQSWISADDVVPMSALRALLNAGADVNAKYGPTTDTALHVLLRKRRHLDATKLLMEHGLDPNEKGEKGMTALHCSLLEDSRGPSGWEKNIEPVVRYLLEHGADPNVKSSDGESPILLGMKHGIKVFEMLFTRCTDDFIKTNCWFDLEKEHGIEQFVQYLEMYLATGIDIDRRNKDGRTLYLCCASSAVNPVEKMHILKSHGAKTDVVDPQGNNALHLASCPIWHRRRLVQAAMDESGLDPLATNNKGDTLLHCVAREYKIVGEYAEYIQFLIGVLGLSVNAQNNKGYTALHVYIAEHAVDLYGAPDWSRFHFLEAINEHNAVDFEIRDMNHLTALHLAALHSDVELAVLVEAGAKIDALTEDGQTALHLACRARWPNTVGLILSRRGTIDIDHQDCFGRTALHYACCSGEAESVAVLLRHGASVSIVDFHGRTPLHACAEFKKEQIIWEARSDQRDNLHNKWLRGPGDDHLRPGRWNWSNGTHLSMSCHGIGPIVKLLLDAGCSPSAADNRGLSALDTALESVCTEFVELFAADDQLFLAATSNLSKPLFFLSPDERDKRVNITRQRMKALMMLMLPRPSFSTLGQDQQTLDHVRKSPSLYLKFLNCEDAAALINANFATDPQDIEHYTVLKQVLRSRRLDLIRGVSDLVVHFSSYTSVERHLKCAHATNMFVDRTLTSLQLACGTSCPNMQLLQLLVEELGVDVNARAARHCNKVIPGGTALHTLARAEHWWQLDGIQYLLDQGADADALDEKGQTGLHLAATAMTLLEAAMLRGTETEVGCIWGREAARVLLAHGANPNILDWNNKSPLHNAVNCTPTMRVLLGAGADPAVGPRPPLFEAIYEQSLEALEVLLDHGASVNSIDETTPKKGPNMPSVSRKIYALIPASLAEKTDERLLASVPLLRALIQRGADLYAFLNGTETLVHYLFEHRRYEMLDALLKDPCLSRIEVNRRDQCGRTILHAACSNDRPGYSGFYDASLQGRINRRNGVYDPQELKRARTMGPLLRLLDVGVDATLVDNDGNTALHCLLKNWDTPDRYVASFIERQEVAPILLVHDRKGLSPLHLALSHLPPSICNLLVAKGADILQPDPDGRTALHYIAENCVRLDAKRSGTDAVEEAAQRAEDDYSRQYLILWQAYLTAGGSINTADHEGNTPLHTFMLGPPQDRGYGFWTKDESCHLVSYYDLLFQDDHHVDIFALNKKGETALHAIASRSKKIGSEALFRKMMSKGLDPLQEDNQGRSALDVASACEQDEILGIFDRK